MPRKAAIGLGIFIILATLLVAGYARNVQRTEVAMSPGVAPEDAMAMSAAPAADSAKMAVSERSAANGAGAAASGAAAPAPAAPQQGLPPLSAAIVDRMIVKTGALTLELGAGGSGDALSAAMQRVNAVVAGVPGAYVAASSTSYRSETPLGTSQIAPPRPLPIPQPHTMATLTLKVPVDAFDQTMQRLREIGSPLAENVSTQEVTEEYVDLEAQVRNLEATEQQYLRFLERAQRIEDILPIQQRLTEVRSQIERIKGRMALLQRRADVSTITVSLILPAGKGGVNPTEVRAVRTLKEAWAHLTVALSGALDLLIYVAVYALPLLPIVAVVVWWRRRQSGAAPGSPATAGGAV